MTQTNSELTFLSTPAMLVFGVIVVVVTAVFSFMIWKRSNFAAATGSLEALRVLIVSLVAITLNQPEWKETFEPDNKPIIALLRDDSGSMTTEDIVDPENASVPPRKRSEIAESLTSAESWNSLRDDFELEIRTFSSGAEGTDITGAMNDVIAQFPGLRGIVLISDGDWNTGDPPSQAATRLRMSKTRVFTVPVGSETRLPDLAVTAFDAPTFGIVDKQVRLPFSLTNTLPREQSTTLEITTSTGQTITSEITIPAMGKIRETILWTPTTTGDFKLTLTIPQISEERDTTNNTLTAPIVIRKEELKVLLIDTYPRWEYRYLRNALERDPGVEVSCLLFHPDIDAVGGGRGYLESFPEADKLAEFDVIVLGDVGLMPNQLTAPDVAALRRQVTTQASGLVLLPGFHGYQNSLVNSELEALFPVLLDPAQPRGWGSATPGQFELTELGARSLLTRLEDTENANAGIWANLPGFQWYAGVVRAKPGSEVLATHSSETNRFGRIPLIVTKTFGTGKILFMGTDGAWRWRKGVEDKYHYRFWGQVARWMAYQRNMASDELMRLFYSPDRPQSGETLSLNANVMSIGGEPLQAATVIVQITSPGGKIESVRLQPGGEEQWGLFTGVFEPDEPGDYQLMMTCAENGGTLETKITVQGSSLEKVGYPARYDVLEEIARITKGEMFRTPDLEAIKAKLSALPAPEPIERRLRIWANPWWIGVIVLLLTVFWIGRKATGAV